MREITAKQLKTIIEKHQLYLDGNVDGERANLSNAYLSGANLSGANLGYANLGYANLGYANLSYADLSYANLSNANLSDAILRGANLSNAYLSNTNLGNANLGYADLSNADLSNTYLRGADLSNADLSNAILPLGRMDRRTYEFSYRVADGSLLIMAGCKKFTTEQAIAHWGSGDYPDKQRGMAYVLTVKYLQSMLDAGCLLGA